MCHYLSRYGRHCGCRSTLALSGYGLVSGLSAAAGYRSSLDCAVAIAETARIAAAAGPAAAWPSSKRDRVAARVQVIEREYAAACWLASLAD